MFKKLITWLKSFFTKEECSCGCNMEISMCKCNAKSMPLEEFLKDKPVKNIKVSSDFGVICDPNTFEVFPAKELKTRLKKTTKKKTETKKKTTTKKAKK